MIELTKIFTYDLVANPSFSNSLFSVFDNDIRKEKMRYINRLARIKKIKKLL